MREAHLRDLISVIERGSVRAAARHLGLTQAAVSKNLIALERSFGVQLLIRSAHGVEPTEYGRLVLRRARVIEAELRKLDQEIAEQAGKHIGAVSIGISSTAEAMLLPRVLERFRKNWPETFISIIGGPPSTIVKAIRESQIDLAVCPAPQSVVEHDIHAERLLSTDMVVVARAAHPLAQHRHDNAALTLDALAPYQWVIGARQSEMEQCVTKAFSAHGMPCPSFSIQRDSFSALIHLLTQSDLLAVSSFPSVEIFCSQGLLSVLPVNLKFPPMIQCLITSTDRPLTLSAEALASEFRRVSRSFRR